MFQGNELKIKVNLLFILLLFFAIFIVAIPHSLADRFDETTVMTSARALSMGNAGINSERGPNSVFYNPANIAAKNTAPSFQLMNFSVQANEMLAGQSQEGGNVNILDLRKFYTTLDANKNAYEQARFSLYPNITLRNLSLGVLYQKDRGAMVRATDGALYVRARDIVAPTAALSFRLFGGILRFGGMVQILSYGYADKYVTGVLAPSDKDWGKQMTAKAGLAKTGGITVSLPFKYLPSFSFVARNIGGTSFSRAPIGTAGSSADSIPTQKMTYDFGSSLTYYVSGQIESKFELDYRDVTNRNKGSRMQRVFSGVEFSLFHYIQLRAGYMHGYPTAGFGIGNQRGSVNISWYSDEMEERLRSFRDQKFVLQYTRSFLGGGTNE